MPGFSSKRRVFMATAAAVLALGAAGCKDKPKFQGSDISGTGLGRDLSMVDGQGHVRTLADYKDKVVVVYFGFTHCPDVCPTALADLSQTMQLLKDDADKVQVLMITVDPERDPPALVDKYAKAFDPRFVGLSGTPEQLHKTAQSFKTFYAKAPGPTPAEYTMDHASSFYILDQSGQARVLLNGNAPAKVIADDIRQLL